MKIKDQKHPDGVWHTSQEKYRGWRLMIKSAENHGMKCHGFAPGKSDRPIFTHRYSFIDLQRLLKNAKKKVNKICLLATLWRECDMKDKSTEFMLEYMRTSAGYEDQEPVINLIIKAESWEILLSDDELKMLKQIENL